MTYARYDEYSLIVIQQLDDAGEIARTFTQHCKRHEIEAARRRIELAYNMDATRVIVDGRYAFGVEPRETATDRYLGNTRSVPR